MEKKKMMGGCGVCCWGGGADFRHPVSHCHATIAHHFLLCSICTKSKMPHACNITAFIKY